MSLRHESGEVLLECELSGAADGGGTSAEQARQGLLQQLRQPQSAVRRHALLRQLRLDESDASLGGGPAAAAAMAALGPDAGRLASPLAPHGGGGGGVGGGVSGGGVGGGGGGATPLLDCLVLKPCSTVGDLVEVCKRASPPLLSGDFVRADARAARPADEQLAKGLPVRKDSVVTAAVAIVRLQTNRRSQWQK